MRFLIAATLAATAALLLVAGGSAQLEFSCTSSQGVAIQARLASLSAADKARFEGPAKELQHDVAHLQETGRKLEADYLTVFYKERNALLEQHPDIRSQILKDVQAKQQPLIDRYWATMANEHPDLAQRAREGDQAATQQLNTLVWNSLLKDPVFNAEFQHQASSSESLSRLLQPRLAASPAYDSSGARMVNFQQQLNDKESEQDKFKSSLPAADGDQLATEAAVGIAKQRGLSVDAANNNRAFRDLLVTVNFANQIRATAGDTVGKSFALQKFDTTVKNEAALAGLGEVMEGAELVRGAMREIRGEALNVRLGFGSEHLGKYLPAPPLRSEAMKTAKSELARSIVATAAVLLNKETNLQESIKLLEKIKIPPQASIDKIVVPAPSTQPEAPAPDNWAKQLATDMKETSELVYQYIVVPKKKH